MWFINLSLSSILPNNFPARLRGRWEKEQRCFKFVTEDGHVCISLPLKTALYKISTNYTLNNICFVKQCKQSQNKSYTWHTYKKKHKTLCMCLYFYGLWQAIFNTAYEQHRLCMCVWVSTFSSYLQLLTILEAASAEESVQHTPMAIGSMSGIQTTKTWRLSMAKGQREWSCPIIYIILYMLGVTACSGL